MSKPLISIVTPCFNEEKNVNEHFQRVSSTILAFRDRYDFEHIYTDNDSSDRTLEKLSQLAENHKNITIIKFSRNIGPNRAMYMGLKEAKGDAVILLLADLEDPPELISEFIKGWEEGHEVVFGKIEKRNDGHILKYFRKVYYNIISLLSEYPIPKNATEFRLVSKRVNEGVLSLNDENPYIRGSVAFVGYKPKAISYNREKRKKGKSSFNFWRLVAYALDGLTATTQAPLRLIMVLGFIITLFGFFKRRLSSSSPTYDSKRSPPWFCHTSRCHHFVFWCANSFSRCDRRIHQKNLSTISQPPQRLCGKPY